MDFLEKNDIWISRYSLRSRGFLNSLSKRREFSGVLIRVGEGYGCIQPWPELGDPTLDKCLEDLRTRRFWPIVRRALRCAEYDDAARAVEESLFEEMEIPFSHATISEASDKEVSAAMEAGFDTIKLKAGRNIAEESIFLETMVSSHPQLKWRLDFNETLDVDAAEKFLGGLSAGAVRAIDFLEDICPYSKPEWEILWKKYRVRLAVDRDSAPQSTAAQVMVIKPAVDEPFLLTESAAQNGQVAVFTSYMDHPLGQTFAAWEAARMNLILPGVIGTCGLQTHHLFEDDAFTEALGEWKPSFSAPSGTGLGFDDQLAQLTWNKL